MGHGVDPERVEIVEEVPGSDIPVHLMYLQTWDGLYAPIGLRTPSTDRRYPLILLASGNGGGGMGWVRDAVRNRGYIMERLLAAGFACTWIRYRAEVELGYNRGGRLVRDVRTGRDLFNRSPLEYEDEIAIIEQTKELPYVDPDRIGLVGMSHGGEMILKITSEYHGVAAAVAAEPAAHEFLMLNPGDAVSVNPDTNLRRVELMEMTDPAAVRQLIDQEVALRRIEPIDTPILVVGRDGDHLQGIFRLTYELLAEAGKDVEWESFDHPLHGYIYPQRGPDGEYQVDETQERAIDRVIGYFAGRFGI